MFTPENRKRAEGIIARYPKPRSATIPLLHLAQEQDGWVSDEAMREIADLVGSTAAEVLGTCSFYEMFKRHKVGRYVINVCTNLSCMLLGSDDLVEHAEEKLGVKVGGTTDDGLFSLEGVQCIAACTEAPCLQVNYRYRFRVTNEDFDQLVLNLAAGHLDDEIPPHGTLARDGHRQVLTPEQMAPMPDPDEVSSGPSWLVTSEAGDA